MLKCVGNGSVSALVAATQTRVYDLYNIAASSVKRVYLSELYLSMDSTVAWVDKSINWILRRFTAGPPTGGSASNPTQTDPNDGNPVTLGIQAGTGGSATFTNLINQFRGMRLPFEWRCLSSGAEIKGPAGNSLGLEATAQSVDANGGAFCTMFFEEG